MTTRASLARARRGEAGFTLIELVVVGLILAVLGFIVMGALDGAKVTARAKAMTVMAADVGKAMTTYNRMNPPITTDRMLAQSTWTATQTEAAGGLYSTTGEKLLQPWPRDPYSGNDLVIQRGATCPTTAAPGTVAVCRVAGASRSALRVRAWAKNRNGASYVVYDQRLA